MKYKILGFLSLVLLLIPGVSSAAPVDLGSLLKDVSIPSPVKIFSCAVVGSISRTNNVTNEVKYKISYMSNYSQLNTPYTIVGSVDRTTANLMVYQAGGVLSILKGEGYLSLQGSQENKFTYSIKDNPGVLLAATINGVKCTSKYFKTIPSLVLTAPALVDLNGIAINTSSLIATTSLNIDVPVQVPPAGVVLPVQAHSCKMLIEAASIDPDSILIGGAISFQNIKVGQYPYTVRGYRSDTPNNVTKYSGVYNAKLDTASGLAFGQEGKAFLFNYDSKVSTDSYIITATLGNIDCSAVIFPSHLAAAAVNNVAVVDAAVVATSSPDLVNGNDGNTGNGNNNGTVAEDNNTNANGVVVVGLSQEERQQGENLGLLSKTGDVGAQAAVQEKIEKEFGFVPAKGAEDPDQSKEAWTSSDYTLIGILGALLVTLISYIVMKYRGMM